jgi:hypothetical protein
MSFFVIASKISVTADQKPGSLSAPNNLKKGV